MVLCQIFSLTTRPLRNPYDMIDLVLMQDLRALLLIFSVQPPRSLSALLQESLRFILDTCHTMQERRAAAQAEARQREEKQKSEQQALDRSTEDGDGPTSAVESEEEKEQGNLPLYLKHFCGTTDISWQ